MKDYRRVLSVANEHGVEPFRRSIYHRFNDSNRVAGVQCSFVRSTKQSIDKLNTENSIAVASAEQQLLSILFYLKKKQNNFSTFNFG